MRTKTIIVIEKGTNHPFSNDPRLEVKMGFGEIPNSLVWTFKGTDAKLTDVAVQIVPDDAMVECSCCGYWHLKRFTGDCRDDDNRFVEAT